MVNDGTMDFQSISFLFAASGADGSKQCIGFGRIAVSPTWLSLDGGLLVTVIVLVLLIKRRCRLQSGPVFNDIEREHAYGDFIIPEEESHCVQHHSPAPPLVPSGECGTYLLSAVKPFYAEAGEENVLNSVQEKYKAAPIICTDGMA